jgi:hypothetical protein
VDREEINSEGREVVDARTEFAEYQAAWEALEALGSGLDGVQQQLSPAIFTAYENVTGFVREVQRLRCTDDPNPVNCATLVNQEIVTTAFEDAHHVRRHEDREISNTNFSPRLAIAWSPWSNGKTALRASTGRYYNLTPLTLTLQELDPDQATIVYTNKFCEPEDTTCVPSVEPFVPSFTVQPVDPDYQTAYQDEYYFGIERQLWAETSVSLEYIGRRYREQPQDENLNVATGDFGKCLYQVSAPGASPAQRHPWIELSPGFGFDVEDPYTGEVYLDTDPGYGDGRIDDCVGQTDSFENTAKGGGPSNDEDNTVILHRADGRPDLYIQNPLWADVYRVGNINSIDYDAFQVRLVRRQYRSWEGHLSYTWSEAIGDGEDYDQALGDDPSLDDVVFGYQSYDIRHSVKMDATTITPWGIRLGTFVTWQSGLPYSLIYQQTYLDAVPPSLLESGPFSSAGSRVRQWYPTGERNDQRNSSVWNVNLKVSKELALSRGMNMQVSAEIFNLLDDGTYVVWNPDSEQGVQVNGIDVSSYRNFGRRWQLGMKLNW